MSVPPAVVMLKSAWARAGASFTPSPVIATRSPSCCHALIRSAFSGGVQFPSYSESPSSVAIDCVVSGLSPESTTGVMWFIAQGNESRNDIFPPHPDNSFSPRQHAIPRIEPVTDSPRPGSAAILSSRVAFLPPRAHPPSPQPTQHLRTSRFRQGAFAGDNLCRDDRHLPPGSGDLRSISVATRPH